GFDSLPTSDRVELGAVPERSGVHAVRDLEPDPGSGSVDDRASQELCAGKALHDATGCGAKQATVALEGEVEAAAEGIDCEPGWLSELLRTRALRPDRLERFCIENAGIFGVGRSAGDP